MGHHWKARTGLKPVSDWGRYFLLFLSSPHYQDLLGSGVPMQCCRGPSLMPGVPVPSPTSSVFRPVIQLAAPQPKTRSSCWRISCPPTPKRTDRKMSSTWLQQNSKFRRKKNAKFSGMLRKYHILQLHNQNPQSRPQAEWGNSLAAFAEVALVGPQDCGSPYGHKVIQPPWIYIF